MLSVASLYESLPAGAHWQLCHQHAPFGWISSQPFQTVSPVDDSSLNVV